MGGKYNVWYYPQAWIKPYKHVALFSSFCDDKKEPVPFDGKLDESLSRTRRLFFDYAMCNDFDLFVTFTFNRVRFNAFDYDAVTKVLRKFFDNFRQRVDPAFRYMLIPERHKTGEWHFHGLCTTPAGLIQPELIPKTIDGVLNMVPNTPGYWSWPVVNGKFGWFSCSYIRDYFKCVKYITKYITKSFDCDDLKGRRLLLKSNGLKKPELVKTTYETVYLPDGFESDFCTVAWRENLENVPAGMVPEQQPEKPEELQPKEFLVQDIISEQLVF